jgi:protein TonB
LLLVVDARGRVSNVCVEKTSHPAFAKPAVDAVKQWKFDPAMRGGQKVACRMRVPIKFTTG